MGSLTLTKKTGFKVLDPYTPIVIRDNRGILFYDTSPILPKVTEFNLPAGKYLIDSGSFKQMANPVKYPLFKLPAFLGMFFERMRQTPYDFRILYGDNPNKCTIFWDKKIILFDYEFQDAPLPYLDFIKFHEFSHARFKTEKYADLMAMNYMIVKGYNPIQIGETPILSLSDRQIERKNFAVKNISNYEKKRTRKRVRLF